MRWTTIRPDQARSGAVGAHPIPGGRRCHHLRSITQEQPDWAGRGPSSPTPAATTPIEHTSVVGALLNHALVLTEEDTLERGVRRRETCMSGPAGRERLLTMAFVPLADTQVDDYT